MVAAVRAVVRLPRLVRVVSVVAPICAVALAMAAGGHADAAHLGTAIHPLLGKWW